MICWYCHWGWAKPVADIYKRALEKLDGDERPLHYGPAHIVWADENFDSAEWCLAGIEWWRNTTYDDIVRYYDKWTIEELFVVKQSLVELAALPIEQRDIVPDDYDGENPQDYPPCCEVVKI